jgi:hypothetical protein
VVHSPADFLLQQTMRMRIVSIANAAVNPVVLAPIAMLLAIASISGVLLELLALTVIFVS